MKMKWPVPMKVRTDPKPNPAWTSVAFGLPKHLRFACSLALVSGAAVGIAAGVSVVTTSGCSCAGTPCDGQIYLPQSDGSTNTADSGDARDASDAGSELQDARTADALGHDGGAGGGPLPAPPLPRAWLS